MVRLSQETGIPLVATNDAHYLKREDACSHEIMLCIHTGKTMSDTSRMRWPTPEFFLKSGAEMQQAFAELEDALDRPFEIAQRCQVRLDKIQEPFPKFEVPEGHTTDTYFEYIARQGFERRRPLRPPHPDGLPRELLSGNRSEPSQTRGVPHLCQRQVKRSLTQLNSAWGAV
jgi:DNA polymerase-3 subunit alpha